MSKTAKALGLWLAAGFAPLLVGCGDDVQEAVQRYVAQQMRPLLAEEKALLDALNQAAAAKKNREQRMEELLEKETLPRYERLIRRLAALPLKQPQVRQLHGRYVTIVQEQYDTLVDLLAAVRDRDNARRETINQALRRQGEQKTEWRADLKKLCERHGLAYGSR